LGCAPGRLRIGSGVTEGGSGSGILGDLGSHPSHYGANEYSQPNDREKPPGETRRLIRSSDMKTLIHNTNKAPGSIVPIAPFEFEYFEIPVRRVSRNRPLQSKAGFRGVNTRHHSRRFKMIPGKIDAAQPVALAE